MIQTGFVKAISFSQDSLEFVGTIHQQGKLCVRYVGTRGQTSEWIFYHAKVHVTSGAFGRDLPEQPSIKRHRLEKKHSEITQTGHYGVVGALKQRYAQPSVTLKRKPIAVRASHSIDSHRYSFIRSS